MPLWAFFTLSTMSAPAQGFTLLIYISTTMLSKPTGNSVTTQVSSRKSAAIERSNAKFNANNFSIIKFMASALDFSALPRNDD